MRSESQPFISVIIPTFNRLSLLKQTIESVRNQTFRDFEIIVVNDGSTDGTAEWLDSQKDLSHIDQANSGIATSRNRGAAAAKGNWLAFLDHDDLWAPDKLEIQAAFLKANPDVGLVAAKHVRLGKPYRRKRRGKWLKGDLFVEAFSKSFIHTSTVIICRDVFDEINGFPTSYRFADEFDVWLKISAAHPIAYVDDALAFIRFYESNTSHDRIGVRTDTYDILMKNYDPERIPIRVFLKTMSDHDISFGRAYLSAGNVAEALKWFAQSVERTPWRMRSLRYYFKYRIVHWLENILKHRSPRQPPEAPGPAPVGAVNSISDVTIDTQASRILNLDDQALRRFLDSAIGEHNRILSARANGVRKDSPESAVTIVTLPEHLDVCVKEFRWRGWYHAAKALFRPTQGLRTFRNGRRLKGKGIGAALPLALIRNKRAGLVRSEWVVMEAVSRSIELDRYILKRINEPWTFEHRRKLVSHLGSFIGAMHSDGVFHSDLKTCNILVSEESSPTSEQCEDGETAEVRFSLLDYDDVTFGRCVCTRRRIKNLVQIFLSTPIALAARDRLRFLNAYASASGLKRRTRREIARQVLERARGKEILYVGFDGDIIEKWDI